MATEATSQPTKPTPSKPSPYQQMRLLNPGDTFDPGDKNVFTLHHVYTDMATAKQLVAAVNQGRRVKADVLTILADKMQGYVNVLVTQGLHTVTVGNLTFDVEGVEHHIRDLRLAATLRASNSQNESGSVG